MKAALPIILLTLVISLQGYSQITTPVIRANFGVDADMRANYFNGSLQAGNDDWYNFPGTSGIGEFVIDTTGAAAIVARYAVDMAFRRTTFARTMRFVPYTIINNRVLLDAILVRDFHGDDSTVFASGGNKNGDNPLVWSTPVSQGIPDKNDILDMVVHARRAGPNGSDSLWLFGGMSLDNTTGNRYFDFEMYQTDLYYNRAGLNFGGVGPDAGHTSWEFDAAGNIIKAGDIIFSAEYQSSSLTNIEARIWIPRSVWTSVTPAAFNWGGVFDGANAGALYGYASIQPKAAGAYYTGLQCSNNTWGGPFGIVLQNDALATDYDARQFVEFSVNLTKLGLDPLTRLGGDPCGMPFRRIIVKTRASASFTAELKDFVAPFAFSEVPAAELDTETPFLCNQGGVADIYVSNPLPTSTYQWSTTNGNIISSTTGPSITVDTPGTYIVTQYLMAGCGAYKNDTLVIQQFPLCDVLSASIAGLSGNAVDNIVHLNWKSINNTSAAYFEIQASPDGKHFTTIGTITKKSSADPALYSFMHDVQELSLEHIYYRIKLVNIDHSSKYSNIIRLPLSGIKDKVAIYPNPVKDIIQVQVSAASGMRVQVEIFDPSGKFVTGIDRPVQRGHNVITIDNMAGKPAGVYLAVVRTGNDIFRQKLLLIK